MLLVTASCSSAVGSETKAQEPDDLSPNTYRLDTSHFEPDGPATFRNESLAFRPGVGAHMQTLTSENDQFQKVYNRISCGIGDDSAESFFGRLSSFTRGSPMRLETVSLEMPDDPTSYGARGVVSESCFAYRTVDGAWHGHFEALPTTHDAAAKVSRITLNVRADHVDVMGVVIFDGRVSSITYVATAE